MLHTATVDPTTLALLKELMKLNLLKNTRLVGGTALALQIGHRKSVDLYFFGSIVKGEFEVANPFASNFTTERLRNTENIKIFLINGIKVDIVNYGYGWLDEPVNKGDIRMASLSDIGAMKVSAVTGRGTKKDFIDLCFLLQLFSMKQLINLYLQKYDDGSEFLALKSLGYFKDADDSEMPDMIIKKPWHEVKLEISSSLKEYISENNQNSSSTPE